MLFPVRKLNCFHQLVNSSILPQLYTSIFLSILFYHYSQNMVWVVLVRNYLFNILEQVIGRRPFCRNFFKQIINQKFQVLGVRWRNGRKCLHNNILVETLHINPLERWRQHDHFIENTSQRPNVRLVVIRQVFPDLRTGIVRGSSLSHAKITNFWDIHVTQFGLALLVDEDVGRFEIAVDDLEFVQLV